MSAGGAGESRIVRYPADWRAVFIVAGALALALAPYAVFGAGAPPWFFYPVWFVVQGTASYLVGGVEHNHCHVKTFRGSALNALFSGALTLALGRPATYLVIPHNLNHHAEFGSAERDWSDPRRIGPRRTALALFLYTARTFWLMSVNGDLGANRRSARKLKRMIAVENLLAAAWFVALAAANPRVFFFATLPGFLLASVGLIAVNVLQHAFCDLGSPHDNSRNFVGRFYNWFSCNGGYHTYHHRYPMAHWSRLPELHRVHVDPKIRPDLNCRSFLRFAFWDFYRVDPKRPIVE